MAKGKRPVPFRTRKLSPSAPMVLPWRRGGRVGRRRTFFGVGPFRFRDGLRHFRSRKGASMAERHGRDRPAPDPPLPDTIDVADLDPELRGELAPLPKERAT